MARFKIVTQASGANYESAGAYAYEMEALGRLDAEIVEVEGGEDEFISAARDADAIYGKGRPRITPRMIEAGKKLKVVSLGSVGVDRVDIAAATERGIPVTNVPRHLHRGGRRPRDDPDARRAVAGWSCRTAWCARALGEGRPQLYQFPRLMGHDPGLDLLRPCRARGRASARRRSASDLAYDPIVEELVMSALRREPVGLDELLERSDIISMHAPGTRRRST